MKRTALIAVVVASFCLPSFALELYVSPEGNDANPGTKGRPLATLTRASDAVRQMKKTSKGSNSTRIAAFIWKCSRQNHAYSSLSQPETSCY